MKIANTTCGGRVISILEGGYNILGGCASPLAQSVLAHVEALCGHFYEECDPAQWEKESEIERTAYEEEARAKGEAVLAVTTPAAVSSVEAGEKKSMDKDDEEAMEEEGSFDFDAMSEEEEEMADKMEDEPAKPTKPIEPVKPVKPVKPTSIPTPVVNEEMAAPLGEEEEDGSEDLENYDMPDIEEGELDKIVDPFANESAPAEESSGRRKRERKKVDYVALEAMLKKEEEEMRLKMLKKQQQQQE